MLFGLNGSTAQTKRTGFDGVSSAEGIRRLKLRSESSSTFNERAIRDSRAGPFWYGKEAARRDGILPRERLSRGEEENNQERELSPATYKYKHTC